MRATVDLDDALVADAKRYTKIEDMTALLREALKALIEREAARRLARLGGSNPNAELVRRRRLE